jgi:dTDP-4-amino-4,6-dideoxygalactose transaminase
VVKVKFLDVRYTYTSIREQLDDAYNRVMRSGMYVGGDEVRAFENKFAKYCEADYCIGVGNGLDALRLGLLACGVKPGDEVLVPANTFIATWLSVSQIGAIPIAIEPCKKTYTMDPSAMKGAITPKTRAVIPVHLYGHPADISQIADIARENDLLIIEDAAQAHGAKYLSQPIGSHGDAVAWSFYPGKNLGAFGDGGAITTNSETLASQLRILHNYGSTRKYIHTEQGYNSRLDPLQAAFLSVKINYLDDWLRQRRCIAEKYLAGLEKTSFILPSTACWATHAWHLFVIRHHNRDAVREHLDRLGVETGLHYPICPSEQSAYRDSLSCRDSTTLASEFAKTSISLPIGPHLNASHVSHVLNALHSYHE